MSAPQVNCDDVVRELWDWLDGEMDADRLEAIRGHLEICSGCNGHVAFARDFLERVRGTLRADEATLQPLRERVLAAMRGA